MQDPTETGQANRPNIVHSPRHNLNGQAKQESVCYHLLSKWVMLFSTTDVKYRLKWQLNDLNTMSHYLFYWIYQVWPPRLTLDSIILSKLEKTFYWRATMKLICKGRDPHLNFPHNWISQLFIKLNIQLE